MSYRYDRPVLSRLPLPQRAAWRAMRSGFRGARIYWAIANALSRGVTTPFVELPDLSVVANRPTDHVSRDMLQGGYERAESALALSLLRPEDTFVDVGANLGMYAIRAARLVGASGRVIALEPGERYHDLTTAADLAALRNITALRVAAGDCQDVGILHQIAGQPSLATLRDRDGVTEESTVDIAKLDSLCEALHIVHARLVKIDTEGYEGPVLRGATELLTTGRVDFVLVEMSPEIAIDNGKDEIVALIDSGWRAFVIGEGGRLRARPRRIEVDGSWIAHRMTQANLLLQSPSMES